MSQYIFQNAAARYRETRLVGFVTRGQRCIHTQNGCINIINLSDMDRARLIDAEWQQGASEGSNGLYLAEIKIFGNNRTGLLVDITKIFTERGLISMLTTPKRVSRE